LECHLHGPDRVGVFYLDPDLLWDAVFANRALQSNYVEAGVTLFGLQIARIVLVGALIPSIQDNITCRGAGADKEFLHIGPPLA
jgi:hypothetical protein